MPTLSPFVLISKSFSFVCQWKMLHEWVTLTSLWMLEIVYFNLWECFVVRKLQHMITVILLVVLQSCLLGRNYLFLGSEQKIYFTFMNCVRWPTVLILPGLRHFLWYRTFIFKTGKIWGKFKWFCHRIFVTLFSQFSSVTQLCPTLCDPVDCSMPGLPVHHPEVYSNSLLCDIKNPSGYDRFT